MYEEEEQDTENDPETGEEKDLMPEEAEEEHYQAAAEELTGTGRKGPVWFNRQKAVFVICCAFAAAVLLGLIFSTTKSKRAKQEGPDSGSAARAPSDFLQREMERSLRQRPADGGEAVFSAEGPAAAGGGGLPEVSFERGRQGPAQQGAQGQAQQQSTQGQYQAPPSGSSGGRQSQPQLSSLVPRMEGSLFSSGVQAPPAGSGAGQFSYPGQQAAADYLQRAAGAASSLPPVPGQQDPYAAQNGRADKQAFYSPPSEGSGVISGNFLPQDILWIGTVIPAVLVTAVSTDLPGDVTARVTQNIYDSFSGTKLLIPQGTLLAAKYNSSVSYAQRRVQIVWDLLIRPDGYQLELEGMNGVDAKGAAGLRAAYSENWFEYLKAAGIIAVFSIATAQIAGQTARYGSDAMAASAVSSNAEFIKELGGNIAGRAANIQPTLTLDSGEKINVMLNKNIFLPPVQGYQVTQKYIR